jgi:hypothetical protein
MIDLMAIIERRRVFRERFIANDIRDDEWKDMAKQAHNDANELLLYYRDSIVKAADEINTLAQRQTQDAAPKSIMFGQDK